MSQLNLKIIILTFLFYAVYCDVAVNKTRYVELDFKACLRVRQTRLDNFSLHKAIPSMRCQENCVTLGYPFGGCDCKTKKCVCADKNADFCRFQTLKDMFN